MLEVKKAEYAQKRKKKTYLSLIQMHQMLKLLMLSFNQRRSQIRKAAFEVQSASRVQRHMKKQLLRNGHSSHIRMFKQVRK